MLHLKRAAAALVTLALLLCLCACAPRDTHALKIQGAQVSYEVYLYFYDKVANNPADYSLTEHAAHADIAAVTDGLCREYVAANTLFAENGMALTADEKASISSRVNTIWRVYEAYYTALGVSKPTITKLITGEFYHDALFFAKYNTGGELAVPEEQLQKYFTENYVVYKAITGYLSTTDDAGNSVALPDAEKTILINKFKTYAQRMQDGESIDEIMNDYQNTAISDVPVTVLQKNGLLYDENLFSKLHAMDAGSTGVITTEKYVFLVEKQKIVFAESDEYATNRNSCLKALKLAEFDAALAEVAAAYTVEQNDTVINYYLKKGGFDVSGNPKQSGD